MTTPRSEATPEQAIDSTKDATLPPCAASPPTSSSSRGSPPSEEGGWRRCRGDVRGWGAEHNFAVTSPRALCLLCCVPQVVSFAHVQICVLGVKSGARTIACAPTASCGPVRPCGTIGEDMWGGSATHATSVDGWQPARASHRIQVNSRAVTVVCNLTMSVCTMPRLTLCCAWIMCLCGIA